MIGVATRFLPERFRGTYGGEIRETFEDEATEAYRHDGIMPLVRITALALADILCSVREHPTAARTFTMAAVI